MWVHCRISANLIFCVCAYKAGFLYNHSGGGSIVAGADNSTSVLGTRCI